MRYLLGGLRCVESGDQSPNAFLRAVWVSCGLNPSWGGEGVIMFL